MTINLTDNDFILSILDHQDRVKESYGINESLSFPLLMDLVEVEFRRFKGN